MHVNKAQQDSVSTVPNVENPQIHLEEIMQDSTYSVKNIDSSRMYVEDALDNSEMCGEDVLHD